MIYNFNCMKCGKPRKVSSVRKVLKPGKNKGVSMWYNTARCPKCHSRMMQIAGIAACTRRR